MYTNHYDNLHLVVFDQQMHERSCNYWYAISSRGISHTAFTTERGLRRWLKERGLKLTKPLTKPGEWSDQRIEGEYSRVSHVDGAGFKAIKPIIETREVCNGRYTLAKITQGKRGREVHLMNPNYPRVEYDYQESERMIK